MLKSSHLSLVLFLCLTALTVQAQQKKPSPTPPQKPEESEDVVRISTELVQTDVMVFDKQGKFVNGLKQDQFELLVDGQPQPIALFDSVVTGARSERAALKAARENKPAPAVEEPENVSDRGRTVIFFINDLFLDPGGLARTHKTISYFIDKQMGPNDQVAITCASGQIGFLQQLTNNKAVLRAALDRLKFVPGPARDMERPPISDYAAYVVTERHDRQLFEALVDETVRANHLSQAERGIAATMVQGRIDMIMRQTPAMVKAALSSLVNLMNSTSKLTGRKLVFFISDGFVPTFTASDFTTMMSRATTAAGRGGVVIYSIDARGLATDPAYDAASGGAFDPTGMMQSHLSGELTFSQEPLYALAADTGGRALLNSNDFQAGIARALDETSRYYLLAWRPVTDAQRGTNFSKIKVTIAGRPDLKVQLRRGYFSPADHARAKAQAIAPVQVETAADDLGLTETTEELHTSLAVGYKQTAGGNMQISTAVQVNALSPNDSSGKLEANVLGAVFDSRGKPVGSFKRQVVVPRTPARATPLYATVNHQVEVPPGLYQVRVFAYERGTTKLSAALDWIEVPKLKPETFAISSLFVGEVSEAAGAGEVTVNANRHFARKSRMRFTTFIYNAAQKGGPPQLGVQIKVLRGEEAIITPPETKVSTDKLSSFTNIPYTGEFPLSSLPPGNYVLQVTITDRGTSQSDSQQLRFTVY